jgi:hypothetical protein
LDAPIIPEQGTAFVTGAKGNKKKGGDKAAVTDKYLKASEWNALSSESQTRIIEARKKYKANDDDDKSTKSTASSRSIKSLSKMLKSLEKGNQKLKRSVSAPEVQGGQQYRLVNNFFRGDKPLPEGCGDAQGAQAQDCFSP